MAKFLVTLEVEFDVAQAARHGSKIKAPRKWNIFNPAYTERWRNYVRNIKVISITDPVLTPEEEKGMKDDWRLANHDLEP